MAPRTHPTEDQLLMGSKHLIYHIKMYVETFLLLENPSIEGWNTERNSIIEAHLVHARLLINFIYPKTIRKTDILAKDYFSFTPSVLDERKLQDYAGEIGGELVHLTTKSQDLKSKREWNYNEISNKLVPVLQDFLNTSGFSESSFPVAIRTECQIHLRKLDRYKVFAKKVVPTT